jgi:UDP-N-acetylmuramyl pentapeptide phosphotransferase/UDP-N-acetylglucosamine-1-phosphate transferase
MGDAGALFLGLLIATLTVRFKPSTDNSITSFAIPSFYILLLNSLPTNFYLVFASAVIHF